jgi:hypothetical protein
MGRMGRMGLMGGAAAAGLGRPFFLVWHFIFHISHFRHGVPGCRARGGEGCDTRCLCDWQIGILWCGGANGRCWGRMSCNKCSGILGGILSNRLDSWTEWWIGLKAPVDVRPELRAGKSGFGL